MILVDHLMILLEHNHSDHHKKIYDLQQLPLTYLNLWLH